MSTADEQGAAVKPRADDSTTEERLGTVSSKTSMRTRSRPNNKSILQSAIARKERSLCVEEKPRARQKRVKQKSLDEPYIDEESSLCKKIPPLKRINKSAVNARKKPLVVAESSINVCDNNETDSKEEREFSQLSISTAAKMTFNASQGPISSPRSECLSPVTIPKERMEELNEIVNIGMDECNQLGLLKAIESCDSRKVAAILKIGNVNVNSQHNNGTFLHLAVSKGSLEIVYLLVLNNVDLDSFDSDQNSPLMCAISENKNDIVKYLVQAGADLTLNGLDGMTSLHIAAKSGNLEACKVIVSRARISNFVNVQDDGGWTPLVWACEHGHSDVIKYLISVGADIHARDVEHNEALHWAAFKGCSEVVELLLNMKADINVTNVHGDTPLHISAREDHYNCVVLLISRKSDMSIINRNNETPVDCAPKGGLCATSLSLNVQLQVALSSPNILSNDISRGREKNPIQCYNNVDSEGEPKNYFYIKSNRISSDNVKLNTNVQYCTCEDRCRSSECRCAELSLGSWYGDDGRLLPQFNFDDSPSIFECSDLCSCNAILCRNRLVQRHLTQRFLLFKTTSKGWGVKSLNFIPTRSFVCEYVGEILTDSEADLREDDCYLFDLDNRECDSFCIDAKYYGNFSRFINHSCSPNLHPIKIFIEHHDIRFPRVAFFARRDIAANEELSFDYGERFWQVKSKSFFCCCETDSCRYSSEVLQG